MFLELQCIENIQLAKIVSWDYIIPFQDFLGMMAAWLFEPAVLYNHFTRHHQNKRATHYELILMVAFFSQFCLTP